MNFLKKYFRLVTALLVSTMVSFAQAATLAPTSITLLQGESTNVTVTNIRGAVTRIKGSDDSLFTYSALSGDNTIKINASTKIGKGKLEVRDAKGNKSVRVSVVAPMTVSPASLTLVAGKSARLTLTNVTGKIQISASPDGIVTYRRSGGAVTVLAKAQGAATLVISDSKTTVNVPVTVTSSAENTSNLNGRLLASNCYQCHGTYGSGGVDKIAGKSDLSQELQEFLDPNGEHPDGIMAAHLKGFTKEQLQAIADYLKNLNY